MNIDKNKIKSLGEFFLIIIILIAIIGGGVFLYYVRDLPRPENFESRFMEPTRIYDQTGETLLHTIYSPENRETVSLDNISPYIKEAVIATEDDDFYRHPGIDFQGIIRAILMDLKIRELSQGASTITQQLIRSYFLTNKKTIERKTKEIVLSLELDRRYSKEKILEWYLNQIPFGSNMYGVEVASQTFFNKSAAEVNLQEAAMLAAIIKAPTYYSPHGQHIDALKNRQNYVLKRMNKEGYISDEELKEAQQKEIDFGKMSQPLKAPHFTLKVKEKLIDKYSLSYLQRKGLKVYTTLNYNLQEKAEELVFKEIKRQGIYNVHNGSVVALDSNTGGVLSLVGSKDYFATSSFPKGCSLEKNECLFTPQFNVAINGKRQPGSALKPFIYAAAFEEGYTPTSTVIDEKTNFGKWGEDDYIPQNYDELFRGEVTLKESLAQSLNVPSVKVLLNLAGLNKSVELIKKCGINTNIPKLPSIVLGSGEVTLLDITSAYGVFPNEGKKVVPVFIKKIEDKEGNVIFQNNKNKTKRKVLTTESAQQITSVLSSEEARAPMFGYNSNLYIPKHNVAAKTGTNQNYKDFWTIGYNKELLVGAWVGNNNQEPMIDKPAVSTAGSLWNKFFKAALEAY